MDGAKGERLLTVQEVAQALHVKESWVYMKAERGELPCIRVGRYLRFDLDRVLASFTAERA